MVRDGWRLFEKGKAEGATQIGEREVRIGGGGGVAHDGFEAARLDADQVGGKESALLEAGAAERGAFLGLLDGAGADGEALGGVGVREAGLLPEGFVEPPPMPKETAKEKKPKLEPVAAPAA